MDIALSLNGEALLSDTGDFLLTSGFDESVRQINALIRTEIGGWKTYPTFGTPLATFIGSPNTRETAQEITKVLEIYLNRFIRNIGVITVRVIPVDEWSINIFIFAHNESGQVPIARLVYSFHDGISQRVFDPAQVSKLISQGSHSLPSNPYLRKTTLEES